MISKTRQPPARINTPAIIVLVIIAGLLVASAIGAYHLRKQIVAREVLSEGKTALEKGQYREACRYLQVYLLHYPDDADWLGRYADANLKVTPLTSNRIANAIGAYRRLLRLRPEDLKTYEQLIKLYTRVRDYNELVHICRQRLARVPDDVPTTLSLVRGLVVLRKNDEAQKELEGLLAKAPGEEDIYILLSGLAEIAQTGDSFALAKQRLDDGLAINPRSARLLAYRARLLQAYAARNHAPQSKIRTDLHADALADLQAATALHPTDSGTRLVMYEVWMMIGEIDRAEAELRVVEAMGRETLEQQNVDIEGLQLAVLKGKAILMYRRGANEEWSWGIPGGTSQPAVPSPITPALTTQPASSPAVTKARIEGILLAQQGLTQLNTSQWVEFLPLAVDLFLAGDRKDLARQAVTEFRQRLKRAPGIDQPSPQQLALLDATVAMADGQAYTVINLLEPIVARRPNLERAYKVLAWAYEIVGQHRRALRTWEDYVSRWPLDPIINTLLVNAYISDQRWAKALEQARRADAVMPKDLERTLLSLRLAELKAKAFAVIYKVELEAMDNLENILNQLETLRRVNPKVVEIRLIRAFIEVYLGRPDDAINELDQAIEDNPASLLPKMQLVDLYSRLGRFEPAIELCRKTIKSHPDIFIPYSALANVYRAANRPDEARQALQNAAEALSDSEKDKASLALGRLLLTTDQRSEGIRILRGLADRLSGDVEVRLRLLALPEIRQNPDDVNRLLIQIKRIEGETGLQWRLQQTEAWLREEHISKYQTQAIDYLNYCIEKDVGWEEPVVTLGQLFERIGEENQAEERYRQYLNLHPDAIRVGDRLLNLLQKKERYVEAWAILHRLPERIMRASTHRVRIAIVREEYDEAIDALEMRVEADPQDAASKALLAQILYIRKNETERSLNLLKEAYELSLQKVAKAPDPGKKVQTQNSELLLVIATLVSILHTENRDPEIAPVLDAEVTRHNNFSAYLMRAEFLDITGHPDQAERDYKHLTTFEDQAAKAYELLGNFYFKTGRPELAAKAWEAGLQKDASSLNLQRRIVQGLLVSKVPAEREHGRTLLDQLLKRAPQEPDLMYYKALLLLQERKHESSQEATRLLEQVVERDPKQVRAWVRLIDLDRRQEDLQKIRDTIARAMGHNPKDTQLLLIQANVEREAGHLLLARSAAQRVIEIQPDDIAARVFLTDLEIQAKNLPAAESRAKQALQLAPDHEEAQLAYARVLAAKNQQADAIRNLEAYCQTHPEKAGGKTLLAIAEMHRISHDNNACGSALDRAEKISPNDPDIFIGRLLWYASQKRFDEMLERFTRRQKQQDEEPEIIRAVASVLAYTDKEPYLRESMKLFNRFITLDPDNVEGYLGLAQVAQQLHEAEVAENAYRQILKISPYHKEAINNLAWLLAADQNKIEEAIELANKGIKRYPDFPYLLDTRGMILMKAGRLQEAQEDLKSCLESPSARPDTQVSAKLTLGRIAVQQNNRERATLYFQQVLQLDDEHHILTEKDRREIENYLAADKEK